MLRLQLTCNSLEALFQSRSPDAIIDDGGAMMRFLTKDLPPLLRRAEAQFAAALKLAPEGSDVKLDLLREDNKRLRRLAKAAAKAIAALVAELKGEADVSTNSNDLEADIRRYLAAQRHQLAWYRDHLV